MDPITIGAIGGLLGGAGQLVGAFSGGPDYGGNVRIEPWTKYTWAKSFGEQQRQFDIAADESIQRRVADAKAAGIHPLYALGLGPTGSTGGPGASSFATSNVDEMSTGDRVARAGSAINRMADALFELDVRKKEAEVRLTEIEAARAASDLQRSGSPGTAQTEARDLYVRWWDNLAGRYVWLPSSEAGVEMPETVGAGYWGKAKMYDKRETAKERKRIRREAAKGFRWSSGPCKGLTASECDQRRAR